MFDGIKGIRWGNRVADVVTKSTEDVLNYVIQKSSYDLSVEDKYIILREMFSGCWTASLFAGIHKSVSQFMIGAALVQASGVVCDWYSVIFERYGGDELGIETRNALKKEVPEDLKQYSNSWLSDLKKNHPELVGSEFEEWLPAIISKTIIEIDYHLTGRLELDLGESLNPFVAAKLSNAIEMLVEIDSIFDIMYKVTRRVRT